MKDLYNVMESILGGEETIIGRATKGAELAASADWLQDHGVKGCTQGVSRPDIHKNMLKDQDRCLKHPRISTASGTHQ